MSNGHNASAQMDTTELLGHASKQAVKRRYEDFCIVDVDCHHYENESFAQIIEYIEDPAIKQEAIYQGMGNPGILEVHGNYQNLAGRVGRVKNRYSEKTPATPHRDITLTKRWMDPLGVDIACLFPTPMLTISHAPRPDVEVAIARAYNRWLVENVLSDEPRIKSMLYLPFNSPDACYDMVEEFGDKPGVIGFMVTAPHLRGVYDNAYMKTYAALEERGLPIAFHGGFTWGGDANWSLANRFITVHAIGFTIFNVLHLSNWIMNALPERFPKLKTIWIESGLAWIPFIMQRLDNEYMMRSSEAPGLKKLPGDYIREMYFTTQPMEMVNNSRVLPLTFEMIKAETQLLYSSDYPHWDMDLPSTIYDLPFLDEQTKRNILGENALRLFNLEPIYSEEKLRRRAARNGGSHVS
jgi:predicted TIM-barrel fold metal-dependent hydrolase